MRATRRNRVHGSDLNPMQRAVEGFLDGDSLVVLGLATLVASKLEKQGATGFSVKMEWLQSEIRKRLLKQDGLEWEHPFSADFPELEGNYSVSIDPNDLEVLAAATEGPRKPPFNRRSIRSSPAPLKTFASRLQKLLRGEKRS